MHPPKMTLHLLSSKGGAFVLKLGLVFKKKAHPKAYAPQVHFVTYGA